MNNQWPRYYRSARVAVLTLAVCAVGLSFGAALLNLVLNVARAGLGQGLAMVAFAGWMVAALLLARKVVKIERHTRFVWALAAGLLVVRLAWIALHSGYPQLADQGIFLRFVRLLREARFSPESLAALSSAYDYYIWVSRGFPFPHLLAWLFPAHDVLALQVANALFLSLTLVVLDRVAAPLLDAPTRRIGLLLYAVVPLHNWQVLEYGHHLFSTLLLVLVVRWACAAAQADRLRAVGGYALLLGSVQFLLALQVGVDQLGFAFLVLTLLCFAPSGAAIRPYALRAIALLLVVAAVSLPAKRAYHQWQAQYDTHRLSSGVAGFMARGYSIERWGEYDGRLEQMDKATPGGEGVAAMMAVPISRVALQPVLTFGVLLPVKIAKYGLVGYATTAEAALLKMQRPLERRLFRAARLLFAPLFLGCVLIGLWRMVSDVDVARTQRLLLVVLPLMGYGIFALLGETSPRYSVYVHPFMALGAAYGVVGLMNRGARRAVAGGVVASLRALPRLLPVYAAVAVLAWAVALHLPARYRYVPFDAVRSDLPVYAEPFLASVRDGQPAAVAEAVEGRVVFHLWPSSTLVSPEAVLQVRAGEELLLERPLWAINRFERMFVDVPRPERLVFSVTDGGLNRIGFVRVLE